MKLSVMQGTHAWRMCRLGLPTASAFHRILTPKKLGISKPGVTTLAAELVAERAMMKPLEIDLGGFAERGSMLENEAVPWYEMQRDVTVSRDGFYLDADLLVGGSPDGLTPDGGLEVKSLSPAKHLRALADGGASEYMAQVQACMWLCERERWDLLFFHPELPSRIIPIALDPEYLKRLKEALAALHEAAAELALRLESEGVDFGPWRLHVEALRSGETPEEPRDESSVHSMWSGMRLKESANVST